MSQTGFKICDQSRVQPGTPDSLWPGLSVAGGRNISPDRQGGAMTRGHSILLLLLAGVLLCRCADH
jgi:hypothetical protein